MSDWSGTDYNPITNNCNTFTSTVLKCVYGMSDRKPNLGVSDMIHVTCPAVVGGTTGKKVVEETMKGQCRVPHPEQLLVHTTGADAVMVIE